ncbi:MAG: response regulator [Deltaproteobacteria bacterium]|nr:response regulator [Deltaproteobacteria bacterium]
MPITLLLADDSVVIQKLVGLSFANEDIEIVTVDNGDDAVSRASECKPDIVLADVVMPGKNGYEVCAAIRSNPQLASTPVLLLTGTFEAFDEGRANEVGATGHITKPFEAQALVDRVTAILAEQRPATPEAVSAATGGDFFDDNFDDNSGDLAQPDSAIAMPADSSPSQDFAFGCSDNEPLSAPMDDVGARTVALDTGADLGELLDGAGGDRTVAIMPDMVGADFAPVSEQSADPTPIPTSTPAPTPTPTPTPMPAPMSTPTPTPTPSPDQTMLVDDLLGSADPVAEPMPPERPMSQPGTPIGAMNIDNPPAPAPAPMPSMDSPATHRWISMA